MITQAASEAAWPGRPRDWCSRGRPVPLKPRLALYESAHSHCLNSDINMAKLLGALGRLGGEKKRPSSMQPLKSGESLEQKLGGAEAGKAGVPKQASVPSVAGAGPKPSAVCRSDHRGDLTDSRRQAQPEDRTRVFAAPLADVVARAPGGLLPSIVVDLISYLRSHGLGVAGIFRVPGDNQELQRLKAAYDSGVPVEIEAATDVHGAASLLKQYLRELPDPPIPHVYYNSFIALQRTAAVNQRCVGRGSPPPSAEDPDVESRLKQLRHLVTKSLPEPNR